MQIHTVVADLLNCLLLACLGIIVVGIVLSLSHDDGLGRAPVRASKWCSQNALPARGQAMRQRVTSDQEHRRSRRLAGREIGVRLGRVFQRIGLMHLDLDRSGLHDLE